MTYGILPISSDKCFGLSSGHIITKLFSEEKATKVTDCKRKATKLDLFDISGPPMRMECE